MFISNKMAAIAAVFALAAIIPSASAHSYFGAAPTGEAGSAIFSGYTHNESFFYNFTSADIALEDIEVAAIVDGNPSRNYTMVYDLALPVSPKSTAFLTDLEDGYEPSPPVYGAFTRADIDPASAKLIENGKFGGVADLLHHVCMGHIFVYIETKDGNQIYAPIKFGKLLPNVPLSSSTAPAAGTAAAAPSMSEEMDMSDMEMNEMSMKMEMHMDMPGMDMSGKAECDAAVAAMAQKAAGAPAPAEGAASAAVVSVSVAALIAAAMMF